MSRRAISTTAAAAIIVMIVVAIAVGGYVMMTQSGKPGPTSASQSASPTTHMNRTRTTASPTSISATTTSASSTVSTSTTTTTTFVNTTTTTVVTTTTGFEGVNVTGVKDVKELFNLFQDIEYKFESSNGTYFKIGVFTLGHETVNGVPCRVIEVRTESKVNGNVTKQNGTVWVNEQTYEVVQVKLPNGQILNGTFAKIYWTVWSKAVIAPFVLGTQRDVVAAMTSAPGNIRITYLGSQQVSYGPTTITVDKYKIVNETDTKMAYWEVWIGHLPNGLHMMTYIKGVLKNGGWYVFELLTLRLSS